MRNLLLTVGLFAALCWIACEGNFRNGETPASLNAAVGQLDSDPWRRTQHGWESSESWPEPANNHAARIHPAIVASFQLLASLGGLLAFANRRPPKVFRG
jgi:hypothetical protein